MFLFLFIKDNYNFIFLHLCPIDRFPVLSVRTEEKVKKNTIIFIFDILIGSYLTTRYHYKTPSKIKLVGNRGQNRQAQLLHL